MINVEKFDGYVAILWFVLPFQDILGNLYAISFEGNCTLNKGSNVYYFARFFCVSNF